MNTLSSPVSSKSPEPAAQLASHPASQVSMVCANFRNPECFEPVMLDWFEFLGGRPGEVVVVDGGSDVKTHEMYFDLLKRGLVDKLQLIRPEHPDNHRDTCYIQEHQAAAFSSKPYVLFWKSDTLPFRKGHDGWLAEAFDALERPDTFAVGGSFNIPSRHHDAWPGYYFSDKCSENFALMKRESFMAAMEEFAGAYITSGFRGTNPASDTEQQRYLIEVAFERYIERHRKYTLVRVEDDTWSVFHTNAAGSRLLELREKYKARIDVKRYLNQGECVAGWGGSFYGRRRSRVWEARVALGRWKRIAVSKLTGRPTGLPDHSKYFKHLEVKREEKRQQRSQEGVPS